MSDTFSSTSHSSGPLFVKFLILFPLSPLDDDALARRAESMPAFSRARGVLIQPLVSKPHRTSLIATQAPIIVSEYVPVSQDLIIT